MNMTRRIVAALVLACGPACLAQNTPTPPAETKPAEPAKAAEPAKPEEKPLKREEKEGGLILEDFVIGTGAEVKVGAVVVAHYRGTLKDGGTEFDSSYKRGEPATFPLKGLIKGWQEGIPGMKVGGKRRLTIPWAMAYGEQGRPPVIPAKADLIFDIEIVDTLQIDDMKVGDGAEFAQGATPTIKFTIRKVGSGEVVAKGVEKGEAVAKAVSASKGEEICKSDEKGEQCDFRFLIPALQMGLDGMKVNGVRKLTFPASMGWQQKPAPVAANARLECEVELVAMQAPPQGMPMGR